MKGQFLRTYRNHTMSSRLCIGGRRIGDNSLALGWGVDGTFCEILYSCAQRLDWINTLRIRGILLGLGCHFGFDQRGSVEIDKGFRRLMNVLVG